MLSGHFLHEQLDLLPVAAGDGVAPHLGAGADAVDVTVVHFDVGDAARGDPGPAAAADGVTPDPTRPPLLYHRHAPMV